MAEMPYVLKIAEIKQENNETKTFYFNHDIDYKPGQFVMLWLPDIDEKPFSLSYHKKGVFGITVERRGGYTQALHKLKAGDRLGVRGPYGKGFTIIKDGACVVAGGCGAAAIMPLIDTLNKPTLIIGFRSKEKIIFSEKIDSLPQTEICTDDGSIGFKGFATERFKEILKTKKFEVVYTCGPEQMMKNVFDLCQLHNIYCEASLERFMVCAIGICGQCACNHIRICVEGPVLGTENLSKLSDFGAYAMLKTGKKVPLNDYYSYRTVY
ncbi:MAG: dihydroorotate dehydrogenase electron transfer subunit [Candidatus Woesearchaeota archaeon]